jgi:hypothetical protein
MKKSLRSPPRSTSTRAGGNCLVFGFGKSKTFTLKPLNHNTQTGLSKVTHTQRLEPPGCKVNSKYETRKPTSLALFSDFEHVRISVHIRQTKDLKLLSRTCVSRIRLRSGLRTSNSPIHRLSIWYSESAISHK